MSMDSPATDLLARLHMQKAALSREPRRSLGDRQGDLKRLEAMVRQDPARWAEAVSADFGHRSHEETLLLEMSAVARSAREARHKLPAWAKPRRVATPLLAAPARSYIRYEPKGVVGIVVPWNYPVQLSLMPLIAALAAGCRVMIKPSELTPHFSRLLIETLKTGFDEDQVCVVEGGPDVAEAFCALPFDHLFYTGSTQVGRKVAQAAAANLTPVTLELGGKSPVVVDADYETEAAAHALAWGRFLNAGQTCVAPDHVLAIGDGRRSRELGQAVLDKVETFYPDFVHNRDYTSLVSERHYRRMEAMVEEARAAGTPVLQPAHDKDEARAARKFPPTVLIDPPEQLAVMQEEIFGPVLPILTTADVDSAIAHINERERPLALYVFSRNQTRVKRILDHTWSGGVTVNGTMLHLANDNLPFGGVGASGYGAYHGRRGFEEFSHARSVLAAGRWHSSRLVAPPYGRLMKLISDMAFKL